MNSIKLKNIRAREQFLDPLSAPPLLQILYCGSQYYMDIIGHVAAAPGPLACSSRSARPRNCLNLTLPKTNNKVVIYKIWVCPRARYWTPPPLLLFCT